MNILVENKDADLSLFTSPSIFATHIPYVLLPHSIRDSECKMVYMCRNVKDNFTFLWQFTYKLRPEKGGENTLEKAYDKFCWGVSPYGPCWDHVLGYWKASLVMPKRVFVLGYWKASLGMPKRVLFLKYEDMKERPTENVKKLSEFIGCPFHEGEGDDKAANEILQMRSFESLSKLVINKKVKLPKRVENKAYFRKGEVGDWI